MWHHKFKSKIFKQSKALLNVSYGRILNIPTLPIWLKSKQKKDPHLDKFEISIISSRKDL